MILRLHITGKNLSSPVNNPTASVNTGFDWADALADASIMGAIAGITCILTTANVIAGIESGALSFFSFLALKRGIVQPVKAS